MFIKRDNKARWYNYGVINKNTLKNYLFRQIFIDIQTYGKTEFIHSDKLYTIYT